MTDSMDVDKPISTDAADENAALHDTNVVEPDADEEDVTDLQDMLDAAQEQSGNATAQIPILLELTRHEKAGPKAIQIKERAVYDLTRAYCAAQQYDQVVQFLVGDNGQMFLSQITNAKTAKVVRQILEIVMAAAPSELEMQADVARRILDWTQAEKRTFLRQRVEAQLAKILLQQQKYADALELCEGLLMELKKFDDKQLLMETHLLESKIHFGLHNVPKAKAALTASRTAANAIYVAPQIQADIDSMSGTIHTHEGDYNTAHSYFLEAFEQLDQMNENDAAMVALKYMMLCKILDSLRHALSLSSQGAVGATSKTAVVDVGSLMTGKRAIKYAGRDAEAMTAIAKAAAQRNLKEFEAVLQQYPHELQDDLLIQYHLHVLQEQLLESNLIRIIEPYSCVELAHIAKLIELDVPSVERKLSQMILDGKLQGILNQGEGQLVVYEPSSSDRAMEQGLQVLANMDEVVSSLFERSKALRTMMI